jgi:hypothetical protein
MTEHHSRDTRERLENVIRVLKEDKGNFTFDMSIWLNGCKTAGCAIGSCTLDPWFQARGLREKIYYHNRIPLFNARTDWEAVWAFFGLTEDEGDYLFLSTEYDIKPDKEMVIARIEQFLKDGEIHYRSGFKS